MKIISAIEKSLLYTVGAAFIVLFAINLAEIFYRTVFGKSLLWVVDFSQLLFIWIMMLAAAVALYRGDHVLIDYFKGKLPKKLEHLVDFATRLCLLVFYIILIVYGFKVGLNRMGIRYVTLGWPTGYAFLALPVSGVFMVLFVLPTLWKHLLQMINPSIRQDPERPEVRS